MKFALIATTAAFLASSAHAIPLVRRQAAVATPEQISQLAPDLGAFPNTNPNQFGDCDGPRQANGEIPRVPCPCPPLRDEYIRQLTANIQAGHAVNNPTVRMSFPVGNSLQDKHDRITAAIITLQNLNGPGKGCPGVSTTLGIQSKNLDTCGDFQCNGNPAPASSSAAPAATSTSSSAAPPPAQTNNPNAGGLSREEVDRLAPQLGGVQNNNPTGTGDCDGPRQPDGTIKKVPCACPPDRTTFINQLVANIQAGHAVNNPSVKLTFPTGNTPQDKRGRLTAATITLQNLNGPGKGCPNVSTTIAQQALNVDKCGDFECGGVSSASVASTESRSSSSSGQQGTTQAPNSNTPTRTTNGGASSTVTVTFTTVVTSVITVTRGQEQKTNTATNPPAATSAPAPVLQKASTASVASVAAAGGAGGLSRDEIDRLAPQLGGVQNNNPTGTGDCDGPRQPDGTIKKVPCACPPDRTTFINQLVANIQAGHAVNNPSVKLTFPTGNTPQDKKGRLTAATITLQNLNGPGKGCPNVSTTIAQQSLNIDACGDFECGSSPAPAPAAAPAPAPSAPAPAQAPVQNGNNPNVLSRDVVDQLAPQLGSEPNRNPTGTGDCDGPAQPDGSIKKVPCACPPTRAAFIDALMANLAVGHAVNNPSVSLSFPTGNSREDKLARITAGTITLQNLNGPGKGCPNVSTTFAQQALAA